MMYTLKGRLCAVVMILLFAASRGDLFRRTRQQQRYNPAIPTFPRHLAPSWEYILHEIILKSVAPPQDANVPYKRPLDASFYGGPVNANVSDDANVLSRGNVYRLLNGHWMLCQDGCVDCEPCAMQRNPLFKWILQRIKPVSDALRHDLQLTIIPQADDRLLASNLWPNSYVYITSQSERAPISIIRTQYNNNNNNRENSFSNLENSFSEQHHRSKDLWRFTQRDSAASQDEIPQTDDRVTIRENASTEQPKKEESPELRDEFRNTGQEYQPRLKPTEEQDRSINLAPRLILGTDQQGQKHLIHMVSADHPSTIANHSVTSQFATGQATQLNDTIPKHEKQAYQRIFRRILDSLNTHRQSIENFLESSPADSAQRMSSSTENMEAVESSWRNRDARHTSARNAEPLRFNDATLPSLYVGNEDRMGRHRYRSSYDYEDTRQNVNNYYTRYRDANQDITLRRQSLIDLDWNGDRRQMHTKSVDSKNISGIDSLISLKNPGNSSLDAISFSSNNGFFIHSGRQSNLNDTFVDKARNNSLESNLATIKRENRQLFKSEGLENGDANRELEASRHSFRTIVTTESPVIRREHETLNRTKTSQITTSKSFSDNQ